MRVGQTVRTPNDKVGKVAHLYTFTAPISTFFGYECALVSGPWGVEWFPVRELQRRVRYLLIRPDGTSERGETDATLDGLSALLGGGYLTPVRFPTGMLYVDEEGLPKGLPVNAVGSALALDLGAVQVSYECPLVGPVVFLGHVETDVPRYIIERHRRLAQAGSGK